jgi:hypothetical protein
MKVIVAGSRTITDYKTVACTIAASNLQIDELISGGAKGVDSLGERYANYHGIPIKQFLADWNLYGKKAGYLRNKQMAEYADALILVWNGKSKGSGHMKELAKKANLFIYEKIV